MAGIGILIEDGATTEYAYKILAPIGTNNASVLDFSKVGIVKDDTPTTVNTYSSAKTQALHDTQAEAIANLATSQARISNTTTPVFDILITGQVLPFTIDVDSTDTNIFTIDDTNNTITFLKNASYNFISTVSLHSSTPQSRVITFNIRNILDNSIITSTSNTFSLANGVTESFTMNTLIVIGKGTAPVAPVTIYIEAVANDIGYEVHSFSSILASSSSYDIATEASGIHFVPTGSISAINVQNALVELDSEKASVATATTIANGLMSSTDKTKLDGITGTNTGDQTTITGNAGSATVLQTARNINGVLFDGSVDITINAIDSTSRIASSEKGVALGVATLDASGTIPSNQLPSYVDDVLEFANLVAFPVTGTSGIIYVALDTNKTYRWSGTAYIYITSGAVDSVAGKTGVVTLVKGDVGLGSVDNTSDLNKPISTATQTALDGKVDDSQVLTNVPLGAVFTDTVYTHPVSHPASIITQDLNNRFVTDAEKATWNSKASTDVATQVANGLMSSTDKTKLDGIATGANNYVLPASVVHDTESGALHATDALRVSGTTLSLYKGDGSFESVITQDTVYSLPIGSSAIIGGTKLFSDVVQSVVANAVSTTASRSYGLQLNSSGQLVVNVPWADTDTNTFPTTYTWTGGTTSGPTASITGSSSTISVAAVPSASSSASGVVTTGAQTFAGVKTFAASSTEFLTTTSTQDGIILLPRVGGTTSLRGTITPGTLTASRTYTLPDLTGTFAMTSQLTSGTVTSVTASGSLASSGGTTPAISHLTTDGNLHVPATGTTNSGKVLTAGATAGSLSWATPASGVTDHTLLTNIGTNTHAQIDTHVSSTSNPHSTTAAQVGAMATSHAANSITGLGATTTALTSGGTGVQGTSTVLARQDHTHTLPAYPTTLPASDVYAWAKALSKPTYTAAEVGAIATGGQAGSVASSEVIKFDTGTTEGTDLYTFNGSTAKTIDIKAGTNVTLTKAAGSVTISANDTSVGWSEITSKPTTLTGYGITDAATSTHNHNGTYQPSSADLTAIDALAGTTGLLKKTATDTWTLDTNAYTTNLGTVTGVTGIGVIASSGGANPEISHSMADGNLHVPATSTINNGKVLTAGATAGSISWVSLPQSGSEHYSQELTPASPTLGATWYVPSTSRTYIFVNDGISNIWVDSTPSGVGVNKEYVDAVSLNNLSDVIAQTPANGNVLSWNGTAWVNSVPSSINYAFINNSINQLGGSF